MRRIGVLLAMSLILVSEGLGQTANCLKSDSPLQETFRVKGIVADAKGPIGKMTVIAFPFLLPGNEPVARFWLEDVVVVKDVGRSQNEFLYKTRNEGARAMDNPKTQTDELGAFSLTVSKGLFLIPCGCKNCRGYKQGELALGVFTELGPGKWQSSRELITVKVDLSVAENDVGQLTFEPAGPYKK